MKYKPLARLAGLLAVPLCLQTGFAATVTVDAGVPLSTVRDVAYGMHTSVYDNQHGNALLPGRIVESGVNTLRYPGGGYADIFHWSITRASWENGITGGGLSPWWGQAGNYGYVASSTDFGSFVGLLDDMGGGQAVITVNFGSALKFVGGQSVVPDYAGQPEEAAAWVAYANAEAGIYGTPNDIVIGVDQQGNNWKTAGYWARLRASTPSEYQAWATADGVYDSYNAFLAIDRDAPVGIRDWEIGNETFGTGYYDSGGTDGYSVNYAVPYPYTANPRYGNAALSPAAYGQGVKAFSQAMKAIDPTIRIGAVVSTPPGDYSWDSYAGQRWTPQVLAQCATNIDFVIAHWYSWAGDNDPGEILLPQVASTIPPMIDGATSGQDSGTASGLRDWISAYRPADSTNVGIFITEFGYFGSISNRVRGAVNACYAADSYSTWMRLGVDNVDYLEMSKIPFLGDGAALTRGAVFYALQVLHQFAGIGDAFVSAGSDSSTLRAQAVMQQSGKLALLLINENRTSSQTANITVSNTSLTNSGTRYQFGSANFSGTSETPVSGPTTNAASGLGNSFSVSVPAYTMMVYVIPAAAGNTAPTLAPIGSRTVNAGSNVVLTASATDPQSPPQTLTFTLLSGPANATLDANSGVFFWRPWVTDAGTVNPITLKVADNGTPSLSATQSFSVTVNPLTVPAFLSAGLSGGQLRFQAGGGDTGPDYAVLASTNLVDWNVLFITNSPPMPFQCTDPNPAGLPAQFYRLKAGPPLP